MWQIIVMCDYGLNYYCDCFEFNFLMGICIVVLKISIGWTDILFGTFIVSLCVLRFFVWCILSIIWRFDDIFFMSPPSMWESHISSGIILLLCWLSDSAYIELILGCLFVSSFVSFTLPNVLTFLHLLCSIYILGLLIVIQLLLSFLCRLFDLYILYPIMKNLSCWLSIVSWRRAMCISCSYSCWNRNPLFV